MIPFLSTFIQLNSDIGYSNHLSCVIILKFDSEGGEHDLRELLTCGHLSYIILILIIISLTRI